MNWYEAVALGCWLVCARVSIDWLLLERRRKRTEERIAVAQAYVVKQAAELDERTEAFDKEKRALVLAVTGLEKVDHVHLAITREGQKPVGFFFDCEEAGAWQRWKDSEAARRSAMTSLN